MVSESAYVQPENPLSKVWRYMDFTKFIAMLEHKGLFFTRLDYLNDPFEGFNGLRYKSPIWDTVGIEEIRALNDTSDFLHKTFKDHQRRRMVNCWHLNEYESSAMWTQYGKTTEAVCIQTTYRNLRECLGEDIRLGLVQYGHNYPSNLRMAFMYKSKEYESEREVRAAIFYAASQQVPESGIWKEANLRSLIENIYVAPNSNPWFDNLVKKVVATYGLNPESVVRSSLDERPSFYLWQT